MAHIPILQIYLFLLCWVCFWNSYFHAPIRSWFVLLTSLPQGYICDAFGWQWVFYIFGAIGCAWFVVWCVVAYDGPDVHPWIGDPEKAYIQSALIECETSRPSRIPWVAIATSPAVWAITCTHVTQNFGYYVLLTELPSYMKNILHFDMKSNAVLSGKGEMSHPWSRSAVPDDVAGLHHGLHHHRLDHQQGGARHHHRKEGGQHHRHSRPRHGPSW